VNECNDNIRLNLVLLTRCSIMEDSIYNIGVMIRYYDHCNNDDKYDKKTTVNFSFSYKVQKIFLDTKPFYLG
jgi:hypothetical protein